VNRHVFTDVPGLMQNVEMVTAHLAKADPDPRHVIALVPTTEGRSYIQDSKGDYWRVFHFITDSLCLEKAEGSEDFYQSAVAFGHFQTMLADFPAQTLHMTIPRFHDTPNRFTALHRAIQADAADRVQKVRKEIAIALEQEARASAMVDMLEAGSLPLRVTHNDTKLNNVMLDAKTRKALCIIDLDTVMPGLAANDFGDSIRFGANTAAEDEADLSKVELSMPLYEAFTNGFIDACGATLTDLEIETLPLGARLMTLENGVRFLTDYLAGDTYYHISHPEHNLDRCRTQFKLMADMDAKWQIMNDVIARARDRL